MKIFGAVLGAIFSLIGAICIFAAEIDKATRATGFVLLVIGVWLLYSAMKKKEEESAKPNNQNYENLKNKYIELQSAHEEALKKLNGEKYQIEIERLKKEKERLNNELISIRENISKENKNVFVNQFSFSEYDSLSSQECKNQISVLKAKEKELVSSEKCFSVDGSISGGKRRRSNNLKQIIRCFNSECDNALLNLSAKTIDTARNKIARSFESLNSIFQVDGISMKNELLEIKLQELNLAYSYELKREQEKEQQKVIKEQMIEEEKVRREIERQKSKIEKDQAQCTNEISKLMAYVQKTSSDIEKQLYIDKIKELEEKLKELESEKASVLEREANARAGFVYIISNIGSFGEGVYKIGMTRRLEPMDRIKELSSASVPFEFDVHAMIFSEDAPDLESKLHRHFEKQSVNRVNLKKEFFRVSIDEIEKTVKENFNNTVIFTKVPVAKEYYQTLEILKEESNK